jgi:hypothetical protein
MRQTSEKEMAAVLKLDPPKRFTHSIKRIVDAQVAWGLWNDGWALLGDDAGSELFPLWPAREYAEVFKGEQWAAFEASEIALDDLLNELLPQLLAKSRKPVVFPTPAGKGVVVEVAQLEAALRQEMEWYA